MRVTIEKHGSRLRLRWFHANKRYTMAVGVDDNATGRAVARQKAGQIETDIAAGYFDPTLLKYKPRLLGKNATEIDVPLLFDRYVKAIAHEKTLTNGSLRRYQGCQSHVHRALNVPAIGVCSSAAGNFAAYLLEHVSARTSKEYLWMLQSCWNWAKGKYRIAEHNPWIAQIDRIKPNLRQKVKPFTSTEILMIQSAFKAHPQYCYYHELVCFLFGTGCRFGEAAGLRWRNVADDFSHVIICEAVSRGEHRNQTKTGKARTVKLNPGMTMMLRSRFEQHPHTPDSLVFASPKGKPIDDHNFNRRAWKTIISQTGIEYRKPYSTRHAAISHALANGANYIAVAEATGHDAKVLHQSYASAIDQKSVFVEF